MNKESNIWEKFLGKKICSERLNVEGFKKKIPFDIYDGHAVCEDFEGHRYDMDYPQLAAVKGAEELYKAVIDYVGNIKDKEEITVLHVLMTFNTLYCDGVEVKPKE
jgi:hypothetical protein